MIVKIENFKKKCKTMIAYAKDKLYDKSIKIFLHF
jgi:hypothetical protein